MIIAEDDNRYNLVTQTDHADLSSAFASRWGNDQFDRIEPFFGMVLAAAEHDNGWTIYDLVPHLNENKAPESHREISRSDWIEFYTTGIENAMDIDLYAGLMVSMHATGIRRQRYGTHKKLPPLKDKPGYVSFVAHQELLQEQIQEQMMASSRYHDYISPSDRECLYELHNTGRYDGHCSTWHNYLLLELFDRLSLHLCINSFEMVEESLGPIYQRYGDVDSIELELHPRDSSEVRVSPYPFDTSPLTVSVMTRTVEGTFNDEYDLWQSFLQSEKRPLNFTIVR